MAKESQMLYTEEGLNKLKAELDDLKNVQRPKNLEAIAVARSFGDLSENAEYDAARNEQAQIEAKIKEIEYLIENAVVVDEETLDASIVSVGSYVKVKNKEMKKTFEYNIVAPNQVSAADGLISDQSPIGKALIGAKKGDVVTLETPRGTTRLEVMDVARAKL